MKPIYLPALAALLLTACGNGEVEMTEPQSADAPTTAKPQSPVSIDYKIIGTPIVGQPVAIEIYVSSTVERGELTLDYRITDLTALKFTETQTESARIPAAPASGPASRQQVRVVPMREGRAYLNVAATMQTETGTLSTASAIPLQVGPALAPAAQEQGELAKDENGEAIRILQGDQSQ